MSSETSMAHTAPQGSAKKWSTKKRDKAQRGVYQVRTGPRRGHWANRKKTLKGCDAMGCRQPHKRIIGPIKSDAIRAYHEWTMCPRWEAQSAEEARQQAERERRQAAARAVTFDQYAETWLAQTVRPHRKARTVDYYRRMLDLHLVPTFGPCPLVDLTAAHVRELIATKLNGTSCPKHTQPVGDCAGCIRPLAKNTVKNAVATLRSILYQAQQDGLVGTNVAARLGKLFSLRHDPRQHVVALELEDVNRILTAAAKWYPDHELAVRVLFYTGMREGELLGLQWDDIDWQRNLMDLRRTVAFRKGKLIVNTPKSGKLRTIDIPASLTARFSERFSVRKTEATVAGTKMSPWVFPALTDTTKPMNDAWLRDRVWRLLLEKAEVRHVRIHDARHTYASLMLRRGVPIVYVSKQLGHSSITVTVDLYGHFAPGADRHHVEGLADAIETAGEDERSEHRDAQTTHVAR